MNEETRKALEECKKKAKETKSRSEASETLLRESMRRARIADLLVMENLLEQFFQDYPSYDGFLNTKKVLEMVSQARRLEQQCGD